MKKQPAKTSAAAAKPRRRKKWQPYVPGSHPVMWPGEKLDVDVLAVHPQIVSLEFRCEAFVASGYLSLKRLEELHARLGELIAPFKASLAAVEGFNRVVDPEGVEVAVPLVVRGPDAGSTP